MYVHRSNRVEVLLKLLAGILRRPLTDPMAPETLVVQSRGLEQWLSRELGSQLGICANVKFPFPRAFLEDCMERVLGSPPETSAAWQPAALQWAIARCLEEDLEAPMFGHLRTYLKADPSDLRRLQLAVLIADRFDQYATYRPEQVASWEDPATALDAEDWQGALWRSLTDHLGPTHLAARARAFLENLESTPKEAFPERVCLFGIPTLPPLYVELLRALGEKIELHLFLLEPSPLFAGDTHSARSIARIEAHTEHTAEELHLETGHPLAASLGWVNRSFQQVLENGTYTSDPESLFQESEEDSLLGWLQNDLLHQVDRRAGGDAEPVALKEDDHSISFHSCHSPMREVEALRDHLQAWLDEDPSRCPEDIVVMAPDIGTYSAAIATVFGHDRGKPNHVPYQIADRSLQSEGEMIHAFLAWLDLAGSRLSAPDVIDLLSRPCVARAFDLDNDRVETLGRWVRELHIHWGHDEAHRQQEGLPACPIHTWRRGLDRMLLGVAVASEDACEDILPYDEMEGESLQMLESFVTFMELVEDLHAQASSTHTAAEWSEVLLRILHAGLKATDRQTWQHDRLSRILRELASNTTSARYDSAISFSGIRWSIQTRLAHERAGHRFASGGVTFCSMLPMRSVPFTCVCLLGLDQEAFPRQEHAPAFDLLHDARRIGDRSRRDEDRHLFLEALLSARSTLRISWVGRSLQDNELQPPSPVVSDLLEWIQASCSPDPTPDARAIDHLITHHPLQPFSPERFQAPRRYSGSHDTTYAAAAGALLGESTPAPRLLIDPLALTEQEQLKVPLRALLSCVESPTRTLLRDRLGLQLKRWEEQLKDRAPLHVGPLDAYTMRKAILEGLLAGDEAESVWSHLESNGTFPSGQAGRCLFDGMVHSVARWVEQVHKVRNAPQLPSAEVDLIVDTRRGPTCVYGALDDLWPDAQVLVTASQLKAKDELVAWVRHLVLCSLPDESLPRRTVLIGNSATKTKDYAAISFRPVEDPAPALSRFVGMYWWAMQEPVPLFPEISRDAWKKRRNGEVAPPLRHKEFEPRIALPSEAGSEYSYSPRPDPWLRKLYAHLDPFGRDWPYACKFQPLTKKIYEDLYQHRESGLGS